MDNLLFGFALFTPISFIPNLVIVFLIGLLGPGLVRAKPSRKEPALLVHHLACVASAAFCSTALPIVFFVFFPIYVENIDVAVIVARLFVFNLALGLVLQVRGHRAIRAAGERYEDALSPSRRPVLLSRFRAGLAVAIFLAVGSAVGGLVVHQAYALKIEGHRSSFDWCMREREREKQRLRDHWGACEEAMACCQEAKGAGS